MDGYGDQRDQGDGDHRMYGEHEPMPVGRVRALGLALDQDTVLVFLADDFWHRLSRMMSDSELGRVGSCPVELINTNITNADAETWRLFQIDDLL